MKGETNIKSGSCSFSAELVAYLYNEMTAAERDGFETHLADCYSCTDELADLSFARLDVYEWHRDEFAEMPTPRIVIPYHETAQASWLDAVRAFFASPAQWAAAGGAFAVAAIVFGVWVYSPSGGEVVKNVPAPTPAIEKAKPADPAGAQADAVVKDQKVSGDVDPTPTTAKAEEPKLIKTSLPREAKPSPQRAVKGQRAVQPRRDSAPRLNDFEDEDDDTLRLGDLLAEVDTRD